MNQKRKKNNGIKRERRTMELKATQRVLDVQYGSQ